MGERIERGREAFTRRAWGQAYEHLSAAAEEGALGVDDLERLAVAAHLAGEDGASAQAWEHAHQECLRLGDPAAAARCAFWLALGLLFRGKMAQASGWLARAHRMVAEGDLDCVARGYLLVPAFFEAVDSGQVERAYGLGTEATEIGRRLGDPDLVALGLVSQGQAAIMLGETARGVALLDEAMVAVTAGEVSPVPAGIVYCAVIENCMRAYDMRRAAEWTEALSSWCDAQPDLVPYQGQCMVHRSQVLQVHGEWPEAAIAAEQARERLARPPHPALGLALYQEAELHRLRGSYREAEAAYREASRHGHEPMPGLALLRLAEGRGDEAAGAIRRAVDEVSDPLHRPGILAACVEITRSLGDLPAARAAAEELAEMAAGAGAPMLRAMAAHATGSVLLAEGDPSAALAALREASTHWQALEMPYEAARTRVLVGLSCAAMGDRSTAELEFGAARAVFAELGATTDAARLEGIVGGFAGDTRETLTAREQEVLRLVAAGKTNRDIAAALVISEHTVARHLQNIFTKLGVPSRAAATAYAYEHDLV